MTTHPDILLPSLLLLDLFLLNTLQERSIVLDDAFDVSMIMLLVKGHIAGQWPRNTSFNRALLLHTVIDAIRMTVASCDVVAMWEAIGEALLFVADQLTAFFSVIKDESVDLLLLRHLVLA